MTHVAAIQQVTWRSSVDNIDAAFTDRMAATARLTGSCYRLLMKHEPIDPLPEGWFGHVTDASDRAIIAVLQSDGRITNRSIAKRLNMPEATVRRRVNKLLDDGVIKIIAVLNTPGSEDISLALVELVFSGSAQEAIDEIAEWVEVTWVAETLGSASVIVEIMFSGRARLYELVRRLRQLPRLQDMRTYEYMNVRRTMYAGPSIDAAD